MKKILDKIKLGDTICYVLFLIFIIISCITPKTGKYVLVDELFEVLLVWMVCIYVVVKILRSPKAKSSYQKTARIFVIVGCTVISIWWAKNMVLDAVNGTEKVHLFDTSVSQYQGPSGIISRHYYLEGTDENGEKMSVEISGKEYEKLLYAQSVVVEYYRYTDRIVKLCIPEGQVINGVAGSGYRMNVKDLSEELERLGISKDLYSLMSGGAPNEKLCLVYDGVWKIYYSERGKQTGEKIFSNEEDACEAFLRKMTRYSKLRQAKLRHFSVLFLLAIFLLCGCAPSEDERKEYIRQGQENAVAYINEKYGFEAEIEEVKLHYVDTSPIPSFTIKFDGEATVTMKYCGRIFDVVVRADEKNSDGKDDYQYEDIVSVFLMELEKETNSHYDYKKSFLFSCEDELGYRDFAAKSMSEYSYFSGDIAWSYSDIQCEHAKELKDSYI